MFYGRQKYRYISIVNEVYKPTNITGGHHPADMPHIFHTYSTDSPSGREFPFTDSDNPQSMYMYNWLVVSTPLKKISQLGLYSIPN